MKAANFQRYPNKQYIAQLQHLYSQDDIKEKFIDINRVANRN